MRASFGKSVAALGAALLFNTAAMAGLQNYGGLWWNPDESGWGLTVDHQGDVVFATLLTYDTAGQPVWHLMSRMDKEAQNTPSVERNNFAGSLYLPAARTLRSDMAFSTDIALAEVGDAELVFGSEIGNVFSYDIVGLKQTRIERFVFGPPLPACADVAAKDLAPNFQGMWGGEPGWGIYAAHQGDTIFGVWLGYDGAGNSTWYSMELAKGEGTAYAGPIIRTTGPGYDVNFDATRVNRTVVGSARMAFADRDHGVFSSTLEGAPLRDQEIQRQVFAPGNACN